jgi:DNA-binding MarR family transcriptional regulator
MTRTGNPAVLRDQQLSVSGAAEIDDVATRLYAAMGRLVRTVRRSGPAEIGPGSFSALATVVRAGPLRLGDLAAREGVAPPTLTRIVSALEQGGYLTREVDPQDRRAVQVSATDRGTELVLGLQSARSAMLRERIVALPPEERRRLETALSALEALADTEG